LPDGRGKHNEDSDDVNRSSSDSKRKWDEDDTSDGQGCHIGSIGVIEIGIADPVGILPAAKQLDLSARASFKIIRVARSIADLEGSDEVAIGHITEALQYRASGTP